MIQSVSYQSHTVPRGGPCGRAVQNAVSDSLDHPTAVPGVDSSPTLGTVLLAGVSGGFSCSSLVLIGPSHVS